MNRFAPRILSTALAVALAASVAPPALNGKPRVTNGGPVIRGPITRLPPVVVEASNCHGKIISAIHAQTTTLGQSQSAAIGYWTANAAQLVGPGFSDWNYAEQKTLTCNPGTTANSFVCQAKGNPCRKPI